jgi:argininosuccinate lyase
VTEPRPLWGGRFSRNPDDELIRLTGSAQSDLRLLAYDAAATKAHAHALQRAGLLDEDASRATDGVCDELISSASTQEPGPDDEDVHSMVERVLTERLGDAGRRIHAGRSRNDLVVADLRLWAKDAAADLARAAADLISVIADGAERHAETAMPGYTHLQRAQPVSLGFHLLAHGFALARDVQRFVRAHDAANVSPLGAGALAGTTLDLDTQGIATELGFARVFDNAMDATSDRDFACDLAYAAALCGVHLSRLAEELVLWTSSEFGFARLADEWSTGSSMMPQKRNPDPAELVRGRAAGGVADLVGLLTLVKGLPLAYNRDLQAGKEPLFAAVDRIGGSLRLMGHIVGALKFDATRMDAAARSSGQWATDLAETLVGRGVPFRDAHRAVGALVADLETKGTELGNASVDVLRTHHPELVADDLGLADPARAINARALSGGTAPDRVRDQVKHIKGMVEELLLTLS